MINQGPDVMPTAYSIYVPPSTASYLTQSQLATGLENASSYGSAGPTGSGLLTSSRLFFTAYTGAYTLASATVTPILIPASTALTWIMTGSMTLTNDATGAHFYNPMTASQKLWGISMWAAINASAGEIFSQLIHNGTGAFLEPAFAGFASGNAGITWGATALMNPGDSLRFTISQNSGGPTSAKINVTVAEL